MNEKHCFVIVACARWETPYIVEWLIYHRAIGFEHVYLYCNDDDPTELYEAVLPFIQGPQPFVTFRHYSEQGMQRKMLMHFAVHDHQNAEWVSFLDLDEFIRLPPGQTLAEFMRDYEDKTDCLMFNWVFFGPNGQATPPKNVLKTLTRRQKNLHPFTKQLFRSSILALPGFLEDSESVNFIHNLAGHTGGVDIRPINVLGEDMHGYYAMDFPAGTAAWLNQPARAENIFSLGALIHHYAHRTMDSFAQRVARGLGGNFVDQGMWGALQENADRLESFLATVQEVEDTSLADFWSVLTAKAQETAIYQPAPDQPCYFVAMVDREKVEQALKEPCKLVIVQPDVKTHYELADHFAQAIKAGHLVLENFMPASHSGQIVTYLPANGDQAYFVATISWKELVKRHATSSRVVMGVAIPGYPRLAL